MPIDLASDALLTDLRRLVQAEGVFAALVGGAVRDLWLGRAPADFDLVVAAPPMPLAKRLARELKGSAVELDADWGIARVILPGGRVIDLAKQQGDRLEDDLMRRDLALNALAVPLDGSEALIDPAGGLEDLRRRRIRAISLENLLADPVRPLRVLRFAATLDFAIDFETLTWVETSRRAIREAAPERTTPELMRILALPQASTWVDRLFGLGIWNLLVPELNALSQVPPSLEHHLDGLAHSLETVRQLDRLLATLPRWAGPLAPRVQAWLDAPSAHAPNLKALLTLGALVHDVGKHFRGVLGAYGEADYTGHDRAGVPHAEAIAGRMRLSVKEREHLMRLVGLHLEPAAVIKGGLDPVEIYRFFLESGETTPGLLLLAIADRYAARGPAVSDAEVEATLEGVLVLMRSYWREDARFTDPPRLLTGADLKALGLPPGPAYARILRTVTEAQVRGDVCDREGAIALATQLAFS
jgi:poly(A) polymerase